MSKVPQVIVPPTPVLASYEFEPSKDEILESHYVYAWLGSIFAILLGTAAFIFTLVALAANHWHFKALFENPGSFTTLVALAIPTLWLAASLSAIKARSIRQELNSSATHQCTQELNFKLRSTEYHVRRVDLLNNVLSFDVIIPSNTASAVPLMKLLQIIGLCVINCITK